MLGKKKLLNKQDRAYLEREYQAMEGNAPSKEMGLVALNRIRVESVGEADQQYEPKFLA